MQSYWQPCSFDLFGGKGESAINFANPVKHAGVGNEISVYRVANMIKIRKTKTTYERLVHG